MTAPVKPPAVEDVELFWSRPPKERSPRCAYWVQRIGEGWSPNRRIRAEGYYSSAEFYGVYIWEYTNVILPLTLKQWEDRQAAREQSP